MKFFISLVLFMSATFSAMASETVDYVDVSKYMGRWYEIARYDNSFQKKCLSTRVLYTLQKNGKVHVLNECLNTKGKIQNAKGLARVVDTETNSKLKVSFVPFFKNFGLFGGDYWIIELGENYEYAVVGHPQKEFLWVLSRTPVLSEKVFEELKEKIERVHGYDLDQLKVRQTWKD